jgi:hypothetical protein
VVGVVQCDAGGHGERGICLTEADLVGEDLSGMSPQAADELLGGLLLPVGVVCANVSVSCRRQEVDSG